ncbi:MAG: hypothetical protein QNJ47_17685 [Nostocaceae cyanobacterium]|nr:hypothetical protein [Nostocaceae cyanobacterium]
MLSETKLFTEVTSEESATVSGGLMHGGGGGGQNGTVVNFDLNAYLFYVGAGVLFGPAGLTDDELLIGYDRAISIG